VQQGNIISFILPIAVGRGGSHREAGNEGRRRSAREKVLCCQGTRRSLLGKLAAVLVDETSRHQVAVWNQGLTTHVIRAKEEEVAPGPDSLIPVELILIICPTTQ